MKDEAIIELFFARQEQAVEETKKKYQSYCSAIAYRVLGSFEDTEECVADAYMKAWNAIPPAKPENLRLFLGKITRNLALDRYRMQQTKKRAPIAELMEEWGIAELEDPSDALEVKELSRAISCFLKTLSPQKQRIFLLRYWYCESPREISRETNTPLSTVNTYLYRTRKQLRTYLEQEGFDL